MSKKVLISGGGVGAYACHTLLNRAGYQVDIDDTRKLGSPVLLLSGQTQMLLRDIFECDTLLHNAVPVEKRVVCWGRREIAQYPHSALVIAEAILVERLGSKIDSSSPQGNYDWMVFNSRRGEQLEFGSRTATTACVSFVPAAEENACYVEAVAQGWLFLIPTGGGRGSLIAVGGSPDELLGASSLVSRQIGRVEHETGSFSAHPRIAKEMIGPGWLACGGAAIAFDPIAGEGCGHALRQAILVSAVIRAADGVSPESDVLEQYSSRILRAFGRHLNECAGYYRAISGDWWRQELRAIEEGLDWVRNQALHLPPDRYRLQDFDLQRL